MMVSNGALDRRGQAPTVYEEPSCLGMGKPQHSTFCNFKCESFARGKLQSRTEFVGRVLIMDQLTNVVQEACDEELFGMFFPDPQGELTGGSRCAEAMFPECRYRQGLVSFMPEHIDDTAGKNQLFERVVTDNTNGVGDRGYGRRQRIQRRIDQMEQASGGDGVLSDKTLDLPDGGKRIVDHRR